MASALAIAYAEAGFCTIRYKETNHCILENNCPANSLSLLLCKKFSPNPLKKSNVPIFATIRK
jgi:hypothetical protein